MDAIFSPEFAALTPGSSSFAPPALQRAMCLALDSPSLYPARRRAGSMRDNGEGLPSGRWAKLWTSRFLSPGTKVPPKQRETFEASESRRDVGIKPGVERSETPGLCAKETQPRRGDGIKPGVKRKRNSGVVRVKRNQPRRGDGSRTERRRRDLQISLETNR